MGSTGKETAHLVGQRIRELRTARGWSLSSLALRAHLGKATLSQIEAGQRNPTLETLYAIAAQLEVGLSALVTPAGADAPVVRGKAVQGALAAVYHDPAVTTEIYRLQIRPGRIQISPGHGPGVIEHLFITSGAVSVGPVGEPLEIAAGADGSWESSGPHSYCALGDQIAEGVLIIRHPR
jgi:XRE family transcriptional regulator, regulator of sulfur utilization